MGPSGIWDRKLDQCVERKRSIKHQCLSDHEMPDKSVAEHFS